MPDTILIKVKLNKYDFKTRKLPMGTIALHYSY